VRRSCPTLFAPLLREGLPALAIVLAHGPEDIEHEGAVGSAVSGMLHSARQHVPLHRSQLVWDTVNYEGLHPTQDDPELLVLVAVQGHRRTGLELDQVQHRPLAEERTSADSCRELECADLVEVHELRLHQRLIILGPVSEREEIRVPGQPEPISHYTDAVRVGDLLFVSGCVPVDADGRLVGGDDVVQQARQTFANVGAVLEAAGSSFADVAKVTVFLTDVDDRAKINPVRQEVFRETRPASTLVEVSRLAIPGAKIEVEAVAVVRA
jgi:2-iminobutanoate/2-iminopropanoate deaminase